VIGPADINFELWFEGSKISNDNPIQVEWQATTAPPPTIEDAHDAALNVPAISRSRNFGGAQRDGRHSIGMAPNGMAPNGSGPYGMAPIGYGEPQRNNFMPGYGPR
jgi:hypothetical protein